MLESRLKARVWSNEYFIVFYDNITYLTKNIEL